MSGEAQLEALLEIINTSTRQAIAEYKKGGNEVPTIHSKKYHPIDFAIDTLALKKAVRLLEGACQQLCASLAPPQHTLYNLAVPFDWTCLRVVFRAGIADVLEKHPTGLQVDELAKLVNLEQGKLARILRLLATKGCFTEVKPNVFANNRISLVTLSDSSCGASSRIMLEELPHGSAALYESLTEPGYAMSYESEKSALMYAFRKRGLKGNLFDVLKKDDDRRQKFHRAMMGLGYITGSLSVLHHYPWNEVKTVCDVGGSIGTVSIPLSKMYPHLKIIDQDLPEVLVQAKEVWARDAPEAVAHNRVEFVPIDFFQQSPIKGQDIYYMRSILHDWPDAKAAIIMKNIRNAMALHSRLLIHDYVLYPATRDRNRASFGADVAPEPMLSNFGNGSNRMYQQDLDMLIAFNAKERTLADLIALGSEVGLRLEKIYDLAETTVLDFRVVG